MPLTGIEPVRCFHRGILSPLRLPVPPQRRTLDIITRYDLIVNIYQPDNSLMTLMQRIYVNKWRPVGAGEKQAVKYVKNILTGIVF